MENNNTTIEWMDAELGELAKQPSAGKFERLPALQIEENKIATVTIDFLKQFDRWEDPSSGVVKKIIPVLHNNEKKVFWVNVKNPIYRDIIEAGKAGQKTFKILRTGQQKGTRYTLIKE